MLFETSWEVCNKVGGIYTVLSSKARTLKDQYKDNLIFIGPDIWTAENPCPYFTEVKSLLKGWMAKASLPQGIEVRVGRWNIPGRPVAILVKFDTLYASKDEAYAKMWERFGVDSLHAYGDYDEGCAFARAAAIVIDSIVRYSAVDAEKVVAHFDEWTTGMGLLELRCLNPKIASVFTTHATSIGRSICGNGKSLYSQLPNYNGDQMARELNMESKHSLEKAAAKYADCFTTVSEVTAAEAEQLLERKADVVTPNGFEDDFVPSPKDYSAVRRNARNRILSVAGALTGIRFSPDTFIIGTSGRLEYRNKGLDMFLDVAGKLGAEAIGRDVLALVMVPGWCAGPREDLKAALCAKEHAGLEDPVLTHRLNNYAVDPVNTRIHQLGFTNAAGSKVSVIYVPCYLNGNDGIFDMTYYELLPGLDATVFASYYEPWGYTPLESIAFGVPTITTTLAGFGAWVEQQWPGADFAACGVRVALRDDNNYSQAVGVITADIKDLMFTPGISNIRNAARQASKKAAWKHFIFFYDQAYYIALQNRDSRVS